MAAASPNDQYVSISGIMAGVENHHWTNGENCTAIAPNSAGTSRPPVSVQPRVNSPANSPNTLAHQYHEKPYSNGRKKNPHRPGRSAMV